MILRVLYFRYSIGYSMEYGLRVLSSPGIFQIVQVVTLRIALLKEGCNLSKNCLSSLQKSQNVQITSSLTVERHNPATGLQQFTTSAKIFGAKLSDLRAHHTCGRQISGNIYLHDN